MNLAAKTVAWGPAPEVNNAAANHKASFRAAGGFNTACCYRLD